MIIGLKTRTRIQDKNNIYLDILYGSGDFEFSVNDNELANYEYSYIDRKIKISPLKTGVFTINIKDKKIGFEHKSFAIIYISPIKKIELIGGGLLMVNDTAQIEMKVYNIYDQIFSVEEVKKMNILIDNNSFNSKGIRIKASEITARPVCLPNNLTVRSVSTTTNGKVNAAQANG